VLSPETGAPEAAKKLPGVFARCHRLPYLMGLVSDTEGELPYSLVESGIDSIIVTKIFASQPFCQLATPHVVDNKKNR
jgi:hypothetical protein